jgi:hypothetical protein
MKRARGNETRGRAVEKHSLIMKSSSWRTPLSSEMPSAAASSA